MTEQPAISINAAFTTGGLPIGVQIIGRRFDDIGVLRLAKAWETARGPITNWPSAPR
jgi:aspartyl-tRNA(Asn)/glutamyl-tRNA(Gln) amidotransferase subunit A